jgi:hypothetical protein
MQKSLDWRKERRKKTGLRSKTFNKELFNIFCSSSEK